MMKGRAKKIFLTLLLGMVAAITGLFVGCGESKKPNVQPEQAVYALATDELSVEMSIFDTKKLDVKAYKNEILVANPSFEWKSSDTNILTVNNGIVTPVTKGSAKVIVSYESQLLEIAVIVTEAGETPILQVECDTVDLLVNSDPFPLVAALYYEAKFVEEAEIVYLLEDEGKSIISVDESGLITPISEGSTLIMVEATWRGITNAAMRRNVIVNVKNDVEIRLDKQGVELYSGFDGTTLNVDGMQFDKTATIAASAYVNGEEDSDAVIAWYTSNEAIVSVNNGAITANQEGEAEVWCSYTDNGREYISAKVEVQVKFPLIDKSSEKTLTLEKASAQLIAQSVFGTSFNGSITAVYDEETPDVALYENGTLNLAAASFGERKLIVRNSEGYAYKVGAFVVTMSIDDEADLAAFIQIRARAVGKESTFVGMTNAEYSYGAGEYYILGANIMATETIQGACYSLNTMTSNIPAANIGFQGTFDGRGYTVYGEFGIGGIFGDLAEGAIVKNLAVVGKLQNVEGATAFGTYIYKTAIDNCYFEVDGSVNTNRHSGVVCIRAEYLTFTNSVIYNKAADLVANSYTSGNFSTYGNGNANLPNNVISNVFLIYRNENNSSFANSHATAHETNKTLFLINAGDVIYRLIKLYYILE